MSAKWMQVLEDAIVGRLVGDLIEQGFRVEISDQDGGGLFVYATPDGGEKPEGGYTHYARLTLGNGADVITDYTTNLESIVRPINEWTARWAD